MLHHKKNTGKGTALRTAFKWAKNVDALANSIIKILKDDSMRKKIGENSYKKMNAELSWDNISKIILNGYKNLVGGNS